MAVKMVLLAIVSMAGISGVLATLLVIAERYLVNYGECKIDINNGDKALNNFLIVSPILIHKKTYLL